MCDFEIFDGLPVIFLLERESSKVDGRSDTARVDLQCSLELFGRPFCLTPLEIADPQADMSSGCRGFEFNSFEISLLCLSKALLGIVNPTQQFKRASQAV